MSQEKRALLAAGLSFLVFLLWYQFYAKPRIPVGGVPGTSVSQAVAPTKNSQGIPVAANLPAVSVGPEQLTVVSNDFFEITFSSYGGRIKDFKLKKFKEAVAPESPPVNLLGRLDERIAELGCQDCNFPFNNVLNYRLVAHTQDEVTFEGVTGGVVIRKTYRWMPDQYLLTMNISLHNQTGQMLQGKMTLLSQQRQQAVAERKGFLSFLRPAANKKEFVYQSGGKVQRFGRKDGSESVLGGTAWGGIEDQYFFTALITRRLASDQSLQLSRVGDLLSLNFVTPVMTIPPQGEHQEEFSLYLGPKDRPYLEQAGVGLEQAVDYGWFGLLAVPILRLLQFFHSWVKNWGVAIILLTLFAKILLNPLSIKSMQQMKEMQRIQPEMQKIKEKYGNDKQRLNAEVMALFKLHKVNPMGGCLPMVLQMPIYIALYKVLYNSIEIYHAPFVGFYRDLSAPDPFFILPLLLGVAMVLQQKLTPQTSVDPAQKQMMMIMPIMFTGFMLFLPLGLVLYIFINTTMSVVQQYMSQRDLRWRDLLHISS